jgi:phosphate transport system ATP-binding protein
MDDIIVEHLSLTYSDGAESLKDINLTIRHHAITALIGPAGGGKSTFLRVFNRLNDLAEGTRVSGRVILDGENILDPKTDVTRLRQKVGMLFARPIPLPLTIYGNVAYGLEVAGEHNRARLNARVEDALRQAQLWDEVNDRLQDPANSISGGQQQRLCLARVLALKPEMILLDEPTSALDPIATSRIESSLQTLKEQYTILIAPHSTQQAVRVGDYVAFFLTGELIEYNTSQELVSHPKDKRTQDYIEGRFG